MKNESANVEAPGKRPHEQSAGGSEASSGKHVDGPPTKASSFRRRSIRLAQVHLEAPETSSYVLDGEGKHHAPG